MKFNQRLIRKLNKKNNLAVKTESIQRQKTVEVCSFDIISGNISLTANGEFSQQINDDQFTYVEKVFTGNETIIATWTNSTKLTKSDAGDYFDKDYSIGRSLNATIDTHSVRTFFEATTGAGDFVSQKQDESLTVKISGADYDKKDRFRLFVIPEYDVDQWLYVESYNIDRDTVTKEILEVQYTLKSLGNLIASSGASVRQFVQRGAIGEGFAYPAFENGKIILDNGLAGDVPITSIQVEFEGNSALNSITVMGRNISINDIGGKDTVEAPRHLLASRFLSPIKSQITKTSTGSPNYYVMKGATAISNYIDWKEEISAQYNEIAEKNFQGYFEQTTATTQGTNGTPATPGVVLSYQHALWSPSWNITVANETNDTQADNYTGDNIILNGQIQSHDILNHNQFISSNEVRLPMSLKEHVTTDAKSLPIIGGFFNILSFGIPVGWKNTDVILRSKEHRFFINAEIFNHAESIVAVDNNIPLDIFTGSGQSDELTAIVGGKNVSTTFHIELTDIYTRADQGTTLFNTRDLGQLDQSDNKIVWNGGCKASLRANTGVTVGYAIDLINIRALAKTDVKITAFRNDVPVFEGIYQTAGKFSGAIREWNTSIRTSPYHRSSLVEGEIDYPAYIQPKPAPEGGQVGTPNYVFEFNQSGSLTTTATDREIISATPNLVAQGVTEDYLINNYRTCTIEFEVASDKTELTVNQSNGIVTTTPAIFFGGLDLTDKTTGTFEHSYVCNSFQDNPDAPISWVGAYNEASQSWKLSTDAGRAKILATATSVRRGVGGNASNTFCVVPNLPAKSGTINIAGAITKITFIA